MAFSTLLSQYHQIWPRHRGVLYFPLLSHFIIQLFLPFNSTSFQSFGQLKSRSKRLAFPYEGGYFRTSRKRHRTNISENNVINVANLNFSLTEFVSVYLFRFSTHLRVEKIMMLAFQSIVLTYHKRYHFLCKCFNYCFLDCLYYLN